MKRFGYGPIGAGVCGFLILSGAGTLFWTLGTEPGARWVFAALESRSRTGLSIGAVDGTLAGGVELTGVRLAAGNDRLEIASVTARLRVNELLGGAVTLEDLRVGEARYRRGDPQPEPVTAGRRAWPWLIVVPGGAVDTLVLESGSETLLFEGSSLALEVSGDRLIANELSTRVEGVELHAQGELQFGAEPRLNAAFEWFRPGEEFHARGEGTLLGPLTQMELHHELAEPFQLIVDGEVAVDASPSAELRLRWTGLAWPGTGAVRSPSGALTLTGGLERYAFRGEGELAVDGIDARFRVRGSGDPASVLLEALELSMLRGELEARGQVRLRPIRWDLAVQGQDMDPGLRWTEWPGRLRGQARLQGSFAPALEWTASDINVGGTLRDYPLAASGSVASRPAGWEFSGVELQTGPNVLAVTGSIGETASLNIELDAPRSELLWPALTGALQVEAAIGGTLARPEIAGELVGQELRWRDWSAEEVRVAGNAARRPDAPLHAAISGAGLKWRDFAAHAIAARIDGGGSSHTIDIGLDTAPGAVRLQADGGLTPTGWSGSLEALALDTTVAGEWRLTSPAAVSLDDGAVAVGEVRVAQSLARLCGHGRVEGTPSDRIELTASRFEMRLLEPLLPGGLALDGAFQAVLSLSEPLGELPGASLSVTGGPGRAAVGSGTETLELGFDRLRLEATLDGDEVVVDSSASAAGSGIANLTARIEDVRGPDPAVRGALQASWNGLELFSVLSPHIGDVTGEVGVDAAIAGTLRAPEVTARGQLRGGGFTVPAWGLEMREIEANATSTDLRTVSFAARGSAGEGRADLDGTVRLDPAAGWPARLTLRGEALEAIRVPEAEIDLAPDLTIELQLPDVRISGQVDVPRARLSLDEISEQAVAPSPDTVVHGVGGSPTGQQLRTQARLQVTLGEEVSYIGGGLTTELTGALNLEYHTGLRAVATGVVELDGDYEVHGQRLSLQRGRLLFAGPLDNPGLDVRAVREVASSALADEAAAPGRASGVRVGVDLSGTLRAPRTRMFSEPPMNEADTLSYLVFGRPLLGTGEADAATLENAALAMGLRQALPAIERVGESVGLDELTLRSTAADAGELMAGKYLGPRLYVRYTYGLFNRIGGLLVQFRLTDRLSL